MVEAGRLRRAGEDRLRAELRRGRGASPRYAQRALYAAAALRACLGQNNVPNGTKARLCCREGTAHIPSALADRAGSASHSARRGCSRQEPPLQECIRIVRRAAGVINKRHTKCQCKFNRPLSSRNPSRRITLHRIISHPLSTSAKRSYLTSSSFIQGVYSVYARSP